MDTTNNLFETSDAVQDILSPPSNKQSSDGYLNANMFGLNLSRSQSAAPMFSSLSSSVSPPRSGRFGSHMPPGGRSESFGETGRGKIDTSDGGLDGGFLFGGPATNPNRSRRNFFDSNDDNEDDDMIPGFIKRPASTGGIDRNYNNDSDRDVNSILETLGLTTLDSTEDIGPPSNGSVGSRSGPSTPKKFFEDDSMIRHQGENVSSSSKASKYFTRNLSNEEEVGASHPSFPGYSNNDYGGHNNGSSSFQGGGQSMQQQAQQQPMYQQFGQQQQPSAQFDSHQQQWGAHDSQQQMYYNQQPSQYLHQPPPQLQTVMPGSQHTMYQMNSPTAQNVHPQQFSYEYQQQQNQQQPHILIQQGGGAPTMAYSPHQQPQFISLVPIQTAHHPQVINGHSAYAYVQYGPDGTMQLHPQPAAPATFIMGPHGQPIALAQVPMTAAGMGFPAALGTSPPNGGMIHNLGSPRTPSRGGGIKSDRGLRTPSTPNGMGKMRGNGLSSPRGGKRGDKNVVVPCRMGPVAAGLLNEIRAAKSRNQWTIHDISGKIIDKT
jgi:hypothetical protein